MDRSYLRDKLDVMAVHALRAVTIWLSEETKRGVVL